LKKLFVNILFIFLLNYICLAEETIKGIDASYIDELFNKGAVYKENGKTNNILSIYENNGINYIRLRLWHSPENQYCSLKNTIELAKKIKLKKFKILLDIHYSDSWADPGKQSIPQSWKNKTFDEIEYEVFNYTKGVIKSFKVNNVIPDIIQIGNEIENGILWHYGKIENLSNFTKFLKQAVTAIDSILDKREREKLKIMFHISCSTDFNRCIWFYENLQKAEIHYDIIGLSYYPWWHGSLKQLESSLNIISDKLKKDIIIVETAYPWTLNWFDNMHNVVGEKSQLLKDYAASVDGQSKFMEQLFLIVKKLPENRGKGIFYWAADCISTDTYKSGWENLTLFDFYGNALPALKVFKNN